MHAYGHQMTNLVKTDAPHGLLQYVTNFHPFYVTVREPHGFPACALRVVATHAATGEISIQRQGGTSRIRPEQIATHYVDIAEQRR